MDFFNSIQTSSSGLSAQRLRMNLISGNLANLNTTHTKGGGPYRRKEAVFAPYQGLIAVDFNIRTHSPEFADMYEPVFEYRFPDHAPPISNAHEGHKLGLEVGGKSGKGHCLEVDTFYGIGSPDKKGVFLYRDSRACRFQFLDERFLMRGPAFLYSHLTSSHGRGDHKSTGLDPVGYDGMTGRTQIFDTPNDDSIRPIAFDIGPHST